MSELLPTATARETVRAVGALARGHRLTAAAGLAALTGATAATLAGPALLGRIVDAVAEDRGTGALAGPVAGLVVAALVAAALTAASRVLIARAGRRSSPGCASASSTARCACRSSASSAPGAATCSRA